MLSQAGAVERSTRAAAARRCTTSSRSTSRSGPPSRAGPRRCAYRRTSRSYKPAEIDQLVAEQITPGLWWDAQGRGALPAAARRRRLPLPPGQRSSAGSTSSCSTRRRARGPRRDQRERRARRCPRASPTTSATSRRHVDALVGRRRRGSVQPEADAAGARAGLRRAGVRASERRNARRRATPWRPPTRRAFVAMLGAAAAALALRENAPSSRAPRSTRTGTTRWIGHC